ncbi:MAG: hypothetical protein IT208_11635 [Chthonomonadales bacterium]|nr:hypothetical protein [Chthonomonadales bacterium]
MSGAHAIAAECVSGSANRVDERPRATWGFLGRRFVRRGRLAGDVGRDGSPDAL